MYYHSCDLLSPEPPVIGHNCILYEQSPSILILRIKMILKEIILSSLFTFFLLSSKEDILKNISSKYLLSLEGE